MKLQHLYHSSVGAYLSLIVSSCDSNRKAGSISGALRTPPLNEMPHVLLTVHLVNQLRIEKKLTVTLPYKKRNRIALLIQRVMKEWMA